MRFPKTLALLGIAAAIGFAAPDPAAAQAQEKNTFKVGYVVYVGFMPLAYMKAEGLMDAWGEKFGIDVELIQINDYVGSINQFIAGELDAVAVAGMDALTMPAAGGVDTSIFLVTDYSNGNDALLSRSVDSVEGLLDDEVYLLQYSVSHYLLNRALAEAGIDAPWRVKTVNISDAEIGAAYITQDSMRNAASWNPIVAEMLDQVPETRVLFDSSQIPGEIMDVFIARTDTLAEHPEFGKALTGAWYEAMAVMHGEDTRDGPMHEIMASAMGTDITGFAGQVDQTHFFYTPGDAADFLNAESSVRIMDKVRSFSFDEGLFGAGAASVDEIGIEVGGTTLGDPENVKLRLDSSFAGMAAAGDI
ncbi:lipid kinase [Salipiger aestuarii]|uniref:putative urea ABC transporter substrate-binding protein n=1 Tax=Salipiger aestuarii TaxID=568098 RepID=UPI00123BE883|nr:putative urea ABC transporter substrate-binding protein [Salipiger aestuarii]KAA8609668.1 lipid kinase [Salipiger aestuarii]